MNTAYHLKVNGILAVNDSIPEISSNQEIKFTWEASEHLKQFTLQISPMPNFLYVQYLRDTDKHGFLYDGPTLKSGTTYYWRIRTGIYEWVSASFRIL
ncbi:MAG: hypothetical protein OSJ52_09120 [Lachnospiraceae bacterium]|nr:hypothetical protein [Lachnospiraceae bacterium]